MSVREHRTTVDWAEEIRYLADIMYPDVEKIILVMDNLNTHSTWTFHFFNEVVVSLNINRSLH